MGFVPLVDAWHASEETRTRLRPGRRWFRMERDLGDGEYLADMTPNRFCWRERQTLDLNDDVDDLTDTSADADRDGDGEVEGRGDGAGTRGPVLVELRERVGQARDAVEQAAASADADPNRDSGVVEDPDSDERREQLARWRAEDTTGEALESAELDDAFDGDAFDEDAFGVDEEEWS